MKIQFYILQMDIRGSVLCCERFYSYLPADSEHYNYPHHNYTQSYGRALPLQDYCH